MSKKKDDQAPTTFPEKWYKVISKLPEFKDTADAASVDDLKKIVVESEGNIFSIEHEMAEDIKLNGAKELVKEYSSAYRDGIKAQTAKIKYALFLLEGKGVDLDSRE
jgi:predicted alternative tryptophan synthase beta-subunit